MPIVGPAAETTQLSSSVSATSRTLTPAAPNGISQVSSSDEVSTCHFRPRLRKVGGRCHPRHESPSLMHQSQVPNCVEQRDERLAVLGILLDTVGDVTVLGGGPHQQAIIHQSVEMIGQHFGRNGRERPTEVAKSAGASRRCQRMRVFHFPEINRIVTSAGQSTSLGSPVRGTHHFVTPCRCCSPNG